MTEQLGRLVPLATVEGSVLIARLDLLELGFDVGRLPYTLRILLENVLRANALGVGSADEVHAVAAWEPTAEPKDEISFRPGRILLQDFTGVPAIVDLAAMREAMHTLGGDAARINPLLPAELVIDHPIQVDEFGTASAMLRNAERDFERNGERYAFLRWGQVQLAPIAHPPARHHAACDSGRLLDITFGLVAFVPKTISSAARPSSIPMMLARR